MDAIHLRLLVPGDDRGQRSIDEALRAASGVSRIRVLGEDAASLRGKVENVVIQPAFDPKDATAGAADPQRFPFLSVFHGSASK